MNLRHAAIAALAATVLAAGCHRRSHSTTVVHESSIFTTDDFPGDAVQDHNVADDRRALSPAGLDVDASSFRVVRNGDRGSAVATYKLVGSGLVAHYFDGERWTPPVALTAADAKLTTGRIYTAVAFLNTADHPDDDARERDGDAIILWIADDVASGGSDGVNAAIFSTQVDATRLDDASANYGFQVLADRLDTLHDGAGDDVHTIGFVSDGLCGEARWTASQFPLYRWGDATTGIVVFWSSIYENDPAPGADTDRTWSFAAFDLGENLDPEVPLTPGAEQVGPINGFGASDTGLSSEETLVGDSFCSYNNLLFVNVGSDADGGSVAGYVAPSTPSGWGDTGAEDDYTIQECCFDLATGDAVRLEELNPGVVSSTDTVANSAGFIEPGSFFSGALGGLFGSDEGLATVVIYTLELIDDPDGSDFGEIDNDGGLLLTEIDEETGVILGEATLSGDDPDLPDVLDENRVDTRIGRNGDSIWVVWIQDADEAPTGPSADDAGALWVSQYITTRIDADGNFPVPPPIATTTQAGVRASGLVAGGWSIKAFTFQECLGYRCGVQSDPDVMNLFYEHSDGTDDAVWMVRLEADLDPAGGVGSTVTNSLFESFTNAEQLILAVALNTRVNFTAVDSGEGGNVLAFFNQEYGGTEYRTFARRTGAGAFKVEVGSKSDTKQAYGDEIFVACDSPGSDIGRFDPATGDDDGERSHPARFVHVFFYEDAVTENDGLAPALRTRRFDLSDPSLPLDDISVPSAGATFELPFDLGVPALFPLVNGPILRKVVVADGRVGVWFSEDDRVYCQEAVDDGDGVPWRLDDDVSDPWLVDDDTSESVVSFIGVFPETCGCDTLHGAMAFWFKTFGASSQVRLQTRVRSSDD